MTADPPTGDLTVVLILFAAWRPCTSCGDLVLLKDAARPWGGNADRARRRSLAWFVGISMVREARS